MVSERSGMAKVWSSVWRYLLLLHLLALCMCLFALPLVASAEAKPPGKPLLHPGAPHRLGVAAATGGAIRSNAGFTSYTLAANDDGYIESVPIGFDIYFGGQDWQYLDVNNNGNVTFDYGLSTYTPFSLASCDFPIIAPFFSDVDTSGGGYLVSYGNDTVGGHNAFGVNWINVGYFYQHTDKLDSFQLVIIDRSDIGAGDFDAEFNYGSITWETGDASGGQDGFGGTPARAGYSDGTGSTNGWTELAGSGVSGALLDGGPDALVAGSLDSGGVAGRYVFHFRNDGIRLLDENPLKYGAVVTSAAADGATEVRVRCQVSGPGVVSLVCDGGASSGTPAGAFVPALGYGNDVSDMTVQQVGDSYYADAIYTVPEGLVDETTHTVTFSGTFTPTGGQPETLEAQSLLLRRPPVVLVHGLWGAGCADDSSPKCSWSPAGVYGMLVSAGYDVHLFDYRYTDASHFKTNAQLLINYILQTLSTLRDSQLAVARVDIVCHSMGGDVTRTMVAQLPGACTTGTFGKSLVRRFVTIGTPHWGSPWALLAWGLHNSSEGSVVDYLASSFDHPIDQGAIEDLREGSTALKNMGATDVASFALIGDVDPANIVDKPVIEFFYQMCLFFGYHPDGVDTSSVDAFVKTAMNNLASDGVVTGPSQAGGLNGRYTQLFEGLYHWQETGAADIGTETANLLDGPADVFASGFPAVSSSGALRHDLRGANVPSSHFRALSSTPLITLTAPAANATFKPGDQITITATPANGANVQAVLFTISDGAGNSALVQQAPFTATFTISNSFVGTLTYSAAARDDEGNVSVTSGTVTVQPTATVQSLSISPSPVIFSSIGQTQQLHVTGSYSGGVQRDITGTDANTSYSSDDPSIISVSSTGLATARSSGNTILYVNNGEASTQVVGQVTLETPEVLAVSPASVPQGATGLTLTLQGLYLGGATAVTFLNGSGQDTQITTGTIQVDSLGQTLTTTLNVGAGATLGYRTIVVTTPGGSSSAIAGTGNQIRIQTPTSTLSVTKSGQGSGDVTSSPSGVECGSTCSAPFTTGASVTLTAQPDAGCVFAGWTGCSLTSDNVCTVTVDQAVSVNARFEPAGSLWQNAIDLGSGWEYLAWFGSFNTAPSPWIYHETLGWLYAVGTSTGSIWFYDPQWDGHGGWWWTGSSLFPWVYSVTESEWLYYDAKDSTPFARWFFTSGGQAATH